MNIVILGLPGSGKGTQADMLAKEFGLTYFDMGRFLRGEAEKNSEIDEYVNKKGTFLPEEISTPLALLHLAEVNSNRENILFDGFPRSLRQLKSLEKWLKEEKKKINHAILLEISSKESVRRLSARRICEKCGTIYNLITNPPREEGRCECGGKLVQREDDKPNAIEKRIKWQNKLLGELSREYEKLGVMVKVNGEQTISEIFEEIKRKLR